MLALSDWFDTFVGAQASLVVLPRRSVASRPASLSAVDASTLALNALTAAQALDLLGLPAGATLAVTGAAGGVGGFAVELARYRGLQVLAVAREADRAFVERTGARLVLRGTDLGTLGADGVLDNAELGAPALAAVRDSGSCSWPSPRRPRPRPSAESAWRPCTSSASPRVSRTLAALAVEGILTARVADTYPFEKAGDAYAAVEAGGLRGLVVLVP